MPAKPAWYSQIDGIIRELEALPRPFVDRATVEALFGVGRRRAQQILAPCTTERVGSNGLADREALIRHLRRLADGDDGHYERQRRRRLAEALDQLRQDRLQRPQLLVEAPLHVLDQELQNLPSGVHLASGRITVEFDEPQQALEKLLALAMAIGNDFDGFTRITRPTKLDPPAVAPEADPRRRPGLLISQSDV